MSPRGGGERFKRGFYTFMKRLMNRRNLMNVHEVIQTATSTATELPEITQAARNLGLVEVRAWVEESVAPTNAAQRSKRCRARAEEMGWRQLSVTAPVDFHPALREIALRTKNGEPLADVLESLLANLKPATRKPTMPPTPPKQADKTWFARAVSAVRTHMRRLAARLSSKPPSEPSA